LKIKDIFDIERGERTTKDNRIKGATPLITATKENNGVVGYIDKKQYQNKKTFKGKITVDMFFNCFYHDYEYFSDDNVHTLIEKYPMNRFVCLFIITILNFNS
jgi:hypothetical protein